MVEKYKDILKEKNIRVTPQRKAILEVLHDCKGHHLEIENIHELLSVNCNRNLKVGMATVYRTMELFLKKGLVSKLSIEKSPARYELITYPQAKHHHLICLKCNRVEEIEDGLTEEFKEDILKFNEFMVMDKPMKIYGYCKDCK